MPTSVQGSDSRAGVVVRSGTTSVGNSLLALAALGSGLVLIATGAGSSPVGAVILITPGVMSLAWAVVVLVRDGVPGLGASFAVAVGSIIGWVAVEALATLGATTTPPLLPMVSSTIMLLVIAGVLAARLRERADGDRGRSRGTERRPVSTGRYVLTLFAGAVVVAALTTPALAQTNAGAFAVPHGTQGSLHEGH